MKLVKQCIWIVFTCSSLNESDVILLFSDFFKAQKIKKQMIVRDARS